MRTNIGGCDNSLSLMCFLMSEMTSCGLAAPLKLPEFTLSAKDSGRSQGQGTQVDSCQNLGQKIILYQSFNHHWTKNHCIKKTVPHLFDWDCWIHNRPLRCIHKNRWFADSSTSNPPSNFTPAFGKWVRQLRAASSF